jgi:hypothetical protein
MANHTRFYSTSTALEFVVRQPSRHFAFAVQQGWPPATTCEGPFTFAKGAAGNAEFSGIGGLRTHIKSVPGRPRHSPKSGLSFPPPGLGPFFSVLSAESTRRLRSGLVRDRQLTPFLGHPEPFRLVQRTERLGCLLCGFLGLLAETDSIFGHSAMLYKTILNHRPIPDQATISGVAGRTVARSYKVSLVADRPWMEGGRQLMRWPYTTSH